MNESRHPVLDGRTAQNDQVWDLFAGDDGAADFSPERLLAQAGGGDAPAVRRDDGAGRMNKADRIAANRAIPAVAAALERIRNAVAAEHSAADADDLIETIISTRSRRSRRFVDFERRPISGRDALTSANGTLTLFRGADRLIGVRSADADAPGFQILFFSDQGVPVLRTITYRIAWRPRLVDGRQVPIRNQAGEITGYERVKVLELSVGETTGPLYSAIEVEHGGCYWFEGVRFQNGVARFIDRAYPMSPASLRPAPPDIYVQDLFEYLAGLKPQMADRRRCNRRVHKDGRGHGAAAVNDAHLKNDRRLNRIAAELWFPDGVQHRWVTRIGFVLNGRMLLFSPPAAPTRYLLIRWGDESRLMNTIFRIRAGAR